MATLDYDLVRHALNIARDSGLDELELEIGDSKFSAVLDRKAKKATTKVSVPATEAETGQPTLNTKPIKAGSVGIFRTVGAILTLDTQLTAGETVGNIVALGISNDVTTPVNGVIREILVEDGQAVEFGQVIAVVEVS
jgi:acetyl-CoA carboxylase biotin carboxyl carrier protein